MKRLTLVVAMAAAALFGTAATARAESGQLIYGGRLAFNYSTLLYSGYTYYPAGYGSLGLDAGLLGRLAVVEGQMGVHVGANFIYRGVYATSNYNSREMAVGVPVLFEINPFSFGGLRSSIYEMIFLQIGAQADYVFNYNEYDRNGKSVNSNQYLFDREKFGVGLVLGAVGYFSSYCSLDIRYYYSFTPVDKELARWYPYTYNFGLSFYL